MMSSLLGSVMSRIRIWRGRLKLRDMNQRHKNAGVEIAAQTSVDSQNHILLQLEAFFMLSCAKLKCIGLLFNFFYLLQYLLSYTMPIPLPTYNF